MEKINEFWYIKGTFDDFLYFSERNIFSITMPRTINLLLNNFMRIAVFNAKSSSFISVAFNSNF